MSLDVIVVAGCAVVGMLGHLGIAQRNTGIKIEQLDHNTREIETIRPIVLQHTTEIAVLTTRCDERRNTC